jgi:hypothetical protein
MASAEGPFPLYDVHLAGQIIKRLKRLQRQATGEDRGEDFLAAVREVFRRLRLEPTTLGEPLYRLPVMRMQIRTVAVRPLVVDFGVCEDRALVFIKGVKLLSR